MPCSNLTYIFRSQEEFFSTHTNGSAGDNSPRGSPYSTYGEWTEGVAFTVIATVEGRPLRFRSGTVNLNDRIAILDFVYASEESATSEYQQQLAIEGVPLRENRSERSVPNTVPRARIRRPERRSAAGRARRAARYEAYKARVESRTRERENERASQGYPRGQSYSRGRGPHMGRGSHRLYE